MKIIDIKSSWDWFYFFLSSDTEINKRLFLSITRVHGIDRETKCKTRVRARGYLPFRFYTSEANKLKYSLGYDFEEALEIVKKKHDYSHGVRRFKDKSF